MKSQPTEWNIIDARYPGKCKQCGIRIARGQKMWFHRGSGALCMPCGNGEDPEEKKLDFQIRREIQKTKDRLAALDALVKPLNQELAKEFRDLVKKLKAFPYLRSTENFMGRLNGPDTYSP